MCSPYCRVYVKVHPISHPTFLSIHHLLNHPRFRTAIRNLIIPNTQLCLRSPPDWISRAGTRFRTVIKTASLLTLISACAVRSTERVHGEERDVGRRAVHGAGNCTARRAQVAFPGGRPERQHRQGHLTGPAGLSILAGTVLSASCFRRREITRRDVSGLEMATDTVANATKMVRVTTSLFQAVAKLATTILDKSPWDSLKIWHVFANRSVFDALEGRVCAKWRSPSPLVNVAPKKCTFSPLIQHWEGEGEGGNRRGAIFSEKVQVSQHFCPEL